MRVYAEVEIKRTGWPALGVPDATGLVSRDFICERPVRLTTLSHQFGPDVRGGAGRARTLAADLRGIPRCFEPEIAGAPRIVWLRTLPLKSAGHEREWKSEALSRPRTRRCQLALTLGHITYTVINVNTNHHFTAKSSAPDRCPYRPRSQPPARPSYRHRARSPGESRVRARWRRRGWISCRIRRR
jgi:hypothetical protein